MSLNPDLFRYFDHLGPTVPLRDLHRGWWRRNIVALRHDIDHDLDLALEVAHHEHQCGMRATYFLLHTHDYWNDPAFMAKCRQLQAYGHEIGLHANVLTEWFAGACDDLDERLDALLTPWRDAGIEVVGTSAHGDRAAYEHGFINYWIWRQLKPRDPSAHETGRTGEGVRADDPAWQIAYPKDGILRRSDGATLPLWSVSLKRHGLTYDARHLRTRGYWSDSGGSWKRTGDPIDVDLRRGRHQVLIHPHWWRGERRTVFCLSTARSGSTWLAQFVDRATSASGLHEYTLNHRRDGDIMVADKRTNDDLPHLIADRAEASSLIRQAITRHGQQRGDVFEANVYLQAFLPELQTLAPDAPIVHLHRDARDVVRSLIDRGWYDTPDDPRRQRIPIDGWDDLCQFERTCWYVRHVNEQIRPFAINRLAFERMTTDLAYLVSFLQTLGLVVHPMLAADAFEDVVNATTTRRFPHPDDWTETQNATFERICGGVQRALGYPTTTPAAVTDAQRIYPDTAADSDDLLTLDFTTDPAPPFGPTRVDHRIGPDGLELRTVDAETPNANVVLATGRWRSVARDSGTPCHDDRYYTVELDADASPEMRARLFVLFFDEHGEQIRTHHLATIRPSRGGIRASFAAAIGSSHLALAIHIGQQSPDAWLCLHRISLRSTVLDAHYVAVERSGSIGV